MSSGGGAERGGAAVHSCCQSHLKIWISVAICDPYNMNACQISETPDQIFVDGIMWQLVVEVDKWSLRADMLYSNYCIGFIPVLFIPSFLDVLISCL